MDSSKEMGWTQLKTIKMSQKLPRLKCKEKKTDKNGTKYQRTVGQL